MKYQLLDTGNCCKLEQCGPYRLVRPALNAFWSPTQAKEQWDQADGVFHRESTGTGHWQWRGKVPERWTMEWGGLTVLVKPTSFGHLGFFAEQHDNWAFYRKAVRRIGEGCRTLNLFGYSGLASMAMAQGGAAVCHLDAAKGMNDWGQEMRRLNQDTVPDRIRWITDDVMKFCARELRRGSRYNGIALDPPSFGRGSSGQVWKIESDLPRLLELCRELIDADKPYFVVLSGHSQGFSPLVQERLLRQVFGKGVRLESMEMTVPEQSGKLYPAGLCTRCLSADF